jgi:very-short-patch-repair endonuclease
MLKKSDIYRLVHDYIEVDYDGDMRDFSYQDYREFYPYYCDLEINVKDYGYGTIRETFMRILAEASPLVQAKILRGVFKKYPLSYFNEKERETKQLIYDEYQEIIARLEFSVPGVSSEVKNLIFAANGPKPEIVLIDAIRNEIKIVKNKEYCLEYDRPLLEKGLLWEELVDWWRDEEELHNLTRTDQRNHLFKRLKISLGDNHPEKILLDTYYSYFWEKLKEKLPALIPQVYLHYDPYTSKQLKGEKRLSRERMDFLLLLPYRKNIVIEIDGEQHYSKNGKANPQLYAEMVAEDRRLRLAGYELYRFGGYEFVDDEKAKQTVKNFFDDLFKLHSIL